ncbi:elongator complex protein 6 isoform X2 [Lycorma delicatula]|uniref:elongator complex protein 6 isoform X2 n=1 Tax=Lycorma delicatula TaxID=130591 RepID=UPI003F51130D
MASSLCASLGFDEYDINNKFVVISEENGCDSSFMIASLLWKGLCRYILIIPWKVLSHRPMSQLP